MASLHHRGTCHVDVCTTDTDRGISRRHELGLNSERIAWKRAGLLFPRICTKYGTRRIQKRFKAATALKLVSNSPPSMHYHPYIHAKCNTYSDVERRTKEHKLVIPPPHAPFLEIRFSSSRSVPRNTLLLLHRSAPRKMKVKLSP